MITVRGPGSSIKDVRTKGGREVLPNADTTVNFAGYKRLKYADTGGGQKRSNFTDVLYGWHLLFRLINDITSYMLLSAMINYV